MSAIAPVPGSQDHLAEEFLSRHRRWLFRDGIQWQAREGGAIRRAGDERVLNGVRLTAREVAQAIPEDLRVAFCSAAHARGALRFAKADRRFQATEDEKRELLLHEARRRTILQPMNRQFVDGFAPLPADIQRQADAEAALAAGTPDF